MCNTNELTNQERDFLGSATYSPEDNKLRFYPDFRLDKVDYDRIRAAGFIWAPKQELFVAPMWTPDRENLLLEWCGEIGDEDKSLVDRAEERAERFETYSENRAEDADRARSEVEEITKFIPMGQPILIGHHSERRARKDAEKIENGMRRAVKLWETSKYWQDRAAGALQAAKYKERPDVRARRIKKIESEKRKTEKTLSEAIRRYEIWLKISNMEGANILLPEDFKDMNPAQKLAYITANHFSYWTAQHPTSHEANKKANEIWHHGFSAYDFLTKNEFINLPFERLTPKQVADLYLQTTKDPKIGGSNLHRWISHLENRLIYERAMLAEGGGTAAEKFDIQIGGKVLVKGEWVVVLKINKSGGRINSLTTNRRYVDKIGIEEVKDYREPEGEAAANVKAVMRLPPLCNYPSAEFHPITEIQWKKIYKDHKTTEYIKPTETTGGHRIRKIMSFIARQLGYAGEKKQWETVPVYITDAKIKDPPKPEPATATPKIDAPERDINAPVRTYKEPEKNEFDAMRDSLKIGVQVVTAPQLFPTPPDIAAKMVELAEIETGMSVLEPSAGTGNLLDAIKSAFPSARFAPDGNKPLIGHDINVSAIEINYRLAQLLRSKGYSCIDGDFLAHNNDFKFDRIIMNPPFENGSDIKHIEHALTFLKPGGRLVALCANGPRQQAAFKDRVDHWEDLPSGSFKEQGTGVNVALIVINQAGGEK